MSKQAPDAKLPNDFAQSGPAKVEVRKPGTTSPKAGRDPIGPNYRGPQGTS